MRQISSKLSNQVTVSDINWIVDRARKRGLENPNTFMSSKPKSGFNHKQYGVTSEGEEVTYKSLDENI